MGDLEASVLGVSGYLQKGRLVRTRVTRGGSQDQEATSKLGDKKEGGESGGLIKGEREGKGKKEP